MSETPERKQQNTAVQTNTVLGKIKTLVKQSRKEDQEAAEVEAVLESEQAQAALAEAAKEDANRLARKFQRELEAAAEQSNIETEDLLGMFDAPTIDNTTDSDSTAGAAKPVVNLEYYDETKEAQNNVNPLSTFSTQWADYLRASFKSSKAAMVEAIENDTSVREVIENSGSTVAEFVDEIETRMERNVQASAPRAPRTSAEVEQVVNRVASTLESLKLSKDSVQAAPVRQAFAAPVPRPQPKTRQEQMEALYQTFNHIENLLKSTREVTEELAEKAGLHKQAASDFINNSSRYILSSADIPEVLFQPRGIRTLNLHQPMSSTVDTLIRSGIFGNNVQVVYDNFTPGFGKSNE